jgi:hypothetical protein
MKIYKRIVIDMTTLEVLEEESYEYRGPIAYCGKGGSVSGPTPDYAYNKKMADIGEANQEMAGEMWNIYKYGTTYNPSEAAYRDENGNLISMTPGEIRNTTRNDQGQLVHPDKGVLTKGTKGEQEGYDPDATTSELDLMHQMLDAQSDLLPYEKELMRKTMQSKTSLVQDEENLARAQLGAKTGLVQYEEDLARAQLGAKTRLTPFEEDLARTKMRTETGLIPERGELESGQIGMERNLLPHEEKLRTAQMVEGEKLTRGRSGVMQSLYKDALAGIDVEGRVSEHRAGVHHAFKNAQGITNRNMSRMGIDPSSGRGLAVAQQIGLDRAKALAGGEHQIRSAAEDENFKRKAAASGLPI